MNCTKMCRIMKGVESKVFFFFYLVSEHFKSKCMHTKVVEILEDCCKLKNTKILQWCKKENR